MKCNCSLNNNYKIIGLCDIEKFNEKIQKFTDKSWSQITLPEKLTLPKNAPSVKSISKVYIDIQITSNRIIRTPSSETPNIEGLKLTGKILLVSGHLCQKIIYVADNCTQSMHSVKFNIPFNTYIIIDENIDMDNDKYCVYPCIEDVSVRVIDKRHLSKTITLFLFAHKIEPPLNINNEFIFYDFPRRNRKEVVRISFNGDERRLIATSTGNPYNSSSEGFTLRFQLRDKTGRNIKAEGEVLQNQDGTNFVNSLNTIPFEIGDLIFIQYQISPNVVLTNFPSDGKDYDMNFVGNRVFKITRDGIVPHMLPNVISLTSINDEPVLNIGFDTFLKILLPHPPTPAVTNPRFTNIEYFTVIVKDSNSTEKYRASMQGNQTGFEITRTLSNRNFEFGDIIELNYKERQRISVTNNPYPTSSRYTLKGTKTSFRITETGLEIINNPQILSNTIILSNSQNEEMLKIEFDVNNLYLIAEATDVIDNDFPGSVLFNFQINNINREMQFGQNAKALASQLDGEPFNLNQEFLISYKPEANNNIKATNYPNQGQEYMPRRDPAFENFRIEQTGLQLISTPPPLPIQNFPNKITIKSKNDEEVATIEFNKDTSKFIVNSTGVVPDPSSTEPYFTFILRNTSSNADSLNISLNSNENAENFKIALNDKNFDFSNNRLILIYKNKTKIEISNFPNLRDMYTPLEDASLFEITQNGLVDKSYSSKIKIYNDNNDEVATVQFLDNDNAVLVALVPTSTGQISTNNLENTNIYAQFTGFDSGIPFNGLIFGKQNATTFVNNIKNTSTNTGFPMRLLNKIPNRIVITNYNGQNEYRVGQEPEFLTLISNVFPYNLDYNKIIFKNNDNSIVLFVHFISSRNVYFIYSTGIINTDSDNFTFKLFNSSGTNVKLEKSINKNQNADSINTAVSERYADDDILELSYSDGSLVEITDIPTKGAIYNPTGNSQSFRLRDTGFEIIPSYKNAITFRGFGNDIVATVEFNINPQKLSVTSSGRQTHGVFVGQEYFALVLIGSDGNIKAQSSVKGDENANVFRDTLNNQNFDYGDFITLRYRERNRVEISNYPNNGQTSNPPNNTESFKILQTGLEVSVPPPIAQKLQNALVLNTTQGQEMLRIEFDITNNKFLATATDAVNNDQSSQSRLLFFQMGAVSQTLNFGVSAKNFASNLNNTPFIVGNSFFIGYFNTSNNNIKITNYPNQGQNYTPRQNPANERFQITQTGLVKL